MSKHNHKHEHCHIVLADILECVINVACSYNDQIPKQNI